MSKGKHGNKEAKKPKKLPPSGAAAVPVGALPTPPAAAPGRQKKR